MAIDQIPRAWLMTDPRMGTALWSAIDRLRACDGIVLRHDALPARERRALAERLSGIARQRGLALSIAGDVDLALDVGAAWVHRPVGDSVGLAVSRPAHSLEQARSAVSNGADLLFVSPVRRTRSHPERPALGAEANVIARSVRCPCIALGGMSEKIFARDYRGDFYGWAGIDAWIRT